MYLVIELREYVPELIFVSGVILVEFKNTFLKYEEQVTYVLVVSLLKVSSCKA